MGDQLSKHATTAGMLCTEATAEVKGLEENMEVYFNVLQGLLLLSYGSTVGAGPTLKSSIHDSIKQVVDCSFVLWRECVSSYDVHNKEQKHAIPHFVGTVWDACAALKKTPVTNIIAIGREMTRVSVSIKDVLREMKELEPCSSNPTQESDVTDDEDNYDDLGKDLSPEEMKVSELAIGVVSELLVVMRELLRSITGLLKKRDLGDENELVEPLEDLLGLCRGVRVLADEIGASLYPPQEFSAISKACEDISSLTDDMHNLLERLNCSTEAFSQSRNALKKALEVLMSDISDSNAADGVAESSNSADILSQIQNLSVDNS